MRKVWASCGFPRRNLEDYLLDQYHVYENGESRVRDQTIAHYHQANYTSLETTNTFQARVRWNRHPVSVPVSERDDNLLDNGTNERTDGFMALGW